MNRYLLAVGILCGLFSVAEARPKQTYQAHPECNVTMPCEGVVTSARGQMVILAQRGFGSPTKTYTPRVYTTRKVAPVRRAVAKRAHVSQTFSIPQMAPTPVAYAPTAVPRHHPEAGPRPGKWCGWFMQLETGITSKATGLNLNLARMWARVGRPSAPGVGTIVVWRGHVGKITGQAANGQWLVKSGNDGRRVRERPRSVAGAIAFRAL